MAFAWPLIALWVIGCDDPTGVVGLGDTSGGAVAILVDQPEPLRVRQGGNADLEVRIERLDGYGGPIDVELVDAPEGLWAEPVRIAAGDDRADLTLQASPTSAMGGPALLSVAASAPGIAEAVVAGSVVVAGAPGALDTSFSYDGIVKFRPTELGNQDVSDVTIDEGGYLLVSGYGIGPAGTEAWLVRFVEDGTADPAFGNGGVVSGFDAPPSRLWKVRVRFGDAPLVLGRGVVDKATVGFLQSLRPDGSPDTAFGDGGRTPAASDLTLALLVGDARILALGPSAIAAFSASGDADPTYVATPSPLTTLTAAVLDTEDRLLLGGLGAAADFTLSRRSAAGNLDTTFGIDGLLSVPVLVPGDTLPYVQKLVAHADGGGVALARAFSGVGFRYLLLRFDADGVPDPAFGGAGGRADLMAGEAINTSFSTLAVQPDGQILAVGRQALPLGILIKRLHPDGSLDPTFGVGGRVLVPESATARAVVLDPSLGRAIILSTNAGYAGGGVHLTRVWL